MRLLGRVGRRLPLALLWIPLAIPAATLWWSASPAAADEVKGDCSGTVNGREAAKITSDDPVVLRDGQSLTVTGAVPFGEAPKNPVSNTTVKVSLVDDVLGITSDEQPSTGATYTSNNVGMEDYFDFGVGLYRIDVTNKGEGGAWTCTYTAYVKLDGGSLSKPLGLVSLGAVLIGIAGLLFAKGRKPREPGWIDGALGTSDQIAREEAWQAAGAAYPEAVRFDERGQHGFLPPAQLAPAERVIWSGKVRVFGRPVAGLFWGLLLGVGIGLLGWQQSRWTVNLGSIVILPVVVAALSLLFAWVGWGYRIRDVVVLPAPPEPEPEPEPEAEAGAESGADAEAGSPSEAEHEGPEKERVDTKPEPGAKAEQATADQE